jgi:hypothetical protein
MTTTVYDAYQQVFALSMLTNMAVRMAGTPQALQQQLANELTAYLDDPGMRKNIGEWSVVWGPAVWQNPKRSTVLENAMYVAHRPEVAFPDGSVRDTYVVGVMATNPASIYGWLREDFTVDQAVKFADYDPRLGPPVKAAPHVREAFVSMGTATGLFHLVHDLVPPQGAPGAGSNIVDFLQGLRDVRKSTLIFAGHSLAGALAPTLALWLDKIGALRAFETKYVYPSAGATPGNAAFALEFRAHFSPTTPPLAKPYQCWNRMLWNTLDLVPHAWHVSDLSEAKTLYGNAPIKEISELIDVAILDSVGCGLDYTRLPNNPLPGQLCRLNEHLSPPQPLTVPPITAQDFVAQALGYQHVFAYQDLLGISFPALNVPLVPGVTHKQLHPHVGPTADT